MIALILAAALAVAPDKPVNLDELHVLYDQSCQVRAYASYDDLCSALRKQIREAEKAQRKGPPKALPASAPRAPNTPSGPLPESPPGK